MPDLTPEEQEALLQQAQQLGPLPVAPVPPIPDVEPPPPPDPNDPHNQYMTAPPEAPPAAESPAAPLPPKEDGVQASAAAPVKAPEVPKPPPVAPPTEAKVVSTAPEWYKAIAPPETSAVPGVIGGLGVGILGALLARKNPAVAAGMAGLGGLTALQAVTDQPQREFDNQLSAAERQAAMHAKLTGSDSELARYRAELAARRLGNQEAEVARKAAELKALKDMNSPETIREREAAKALVATMTVPDAQKQAYLTAIDGMDGDVVRRYRAQLGQMAGQARGAGNALDMQSVRENAQIAQENRAEQRQLGKEGREVEQQIAKEGREVERGKKRAQIGGWEYIGEGDPSNADTNAARQMASQVGRAVRAARELEQLSRKVKLSAQGGGLIYQAFGTDEEQKRIISRMKTLQNILGAAQREIFHQGVPQEFEMAINSKTNPEADSLRAIVEGRISWQQLGDVMRNEGVQQMFNYNYALPEGSDLAQSGIDVKEGPRDFKKELAAGAGETAGMVDKAKGVAGQVVKNAANTAKQVAGAAAPAVKSFKVRVFDPKTKTWGQEAMRTQEQIDAAKAKLAKMGLPASFISVTQ